MVEQELFLSLADVWQIDRRQIRGLVQLLYERPQLVSQVGNRLVFQHFLDRVNDLLDAHALFYQLFDVAGLLLYSHINLAIVHSVENLLACNLEILAPALRHTFQKKSELLGSSMNKFIAKGKARALSDLKLPLSYLEYNIGGDEN